MTPITRELGMKATRDYQSRTLAEWDQRAKAKDERDEVRLEAGTFAAEMFRPGTTETTKGD